MSRFASEMFRPHPAYLDVELDADDRLHLLAAAVDALEVSVVVTEAALDPPGPRILYANPAFSRLSGWAPEDLAGRSPRMLQGPATDRAVLDRLRDDLEHGRLFHGETFNYRKDGTPFVMEWLISPITDPSGAVCFFVAVQLDRTERRRLEEIAEAVNMMEHVGFLFASLRHELANPMASIKAALDVLRQGADSYGPSDILRITALMQADLARVEYLLNALRSFNRFERPHVEPLDLAAFLESLRALLARELKTGEIKLEIRTPSGESQAFADPRALHQVLLNLVSNARDAIGVHPEGQIELVLEGRGAWREIVVADNGVGMSETQLTTLFRPFVTHKPKGTGLGLSIVKKLVTGMGGTISVKSRVGEGSSFRLALPAVVAPPA